MVSSVSFTLGNTLSECVAQDPQSSLSIFTTLGTAVLSSLHLDVVVLFIRKTHLLSSPDSILALANME